MSDMVLFLLFLPKRVWLFAGPKPNNMDFLLWHLRVGRACIFFHNIVHEGVPPDPGSVKYIIRSDIMYRRSPMLHDSEQDKAAFALYQQADELSAQGRVSETCFFSRGQACIVCD